MATQPYLSDPGDVVISNDGITSVTGAVAVVTSTPGSTATQNAAAASTTKPTQVNSASINAIAEQTGFIFKKNTITPPAASSPQKKIRFTMQLGSQYTFQAHLDPNDINRQKNKRIAMLDVLGGVVVQDFGFKAEILEVRGTTGSKYYAEIDLMQKIFDNQNLGAPTTVTVTLDGYTYSAVLQQFTSSRNINQTSGNIINYSMQFIILSSPAGATTGTDTTAAGASTVQTATSTMASNSLTGKSALTNLPWSGSLNQYLQTQLSGASFRNQSAVITALQQNYQPSLNGGASFPTSFNTSLGPNGVLTVANNWANKFSGP